MNREGGRKKERKKNQAAASERGRDGRGRKRERERERAVLYAGATRKTPEQKTPEKTRVNEVSRVGLNVRYATYTRGRARARQKDRSLARSLARTDGLRHFPGSL